MKTIHSEIIPKDRKMGRTMYHALRRLLRYQAWVNTPKIHRMWMDTFLYGTGYFKL